MPSKYVPETYFVRQTEEDPNGWRRYFRMSSFGWFNKPEGEACVEKFCSLNYYAFWASMPPIMLYYLAYKKIRNPLGVAYYYTKCAWPFHATASTFAITACGLASYRGKDDGFNWAAAGFLAGAMPGFGIRPYLIRKKAYGTGMWFWAVPAGMIYGAIIAYFMKVNDPRFVLDNWININEKAQFQPEKKMFQYEDFTMPNERLSLDFIHGGKGGDMPFSWVGEKFEHRLLLNKQEYGYLECELDKVPAIEKAIRNRV